jgi:hypothetical protein
LCFGERRDLTLACDACTCGSVVALVIEEGAHHLDLMFSDPDDPDSVIQVRRQELSHIKKWVEQARSRSVQARL